jgi:exosortase
MIPRRLSKNGWTVWHVVSATVMLLCALAITWRGWVQIIELGLTRTVAGHIFLVPVVATWLFWVRRKRMQLCKPSGSLPGLLLAVLGAMAFVYGDKRVHPWLFHLGTVLLPVGCVVAILGRQVLMAYLPAFIVLLGLVPPPIAWAEQLAQPLQAATGNLTAGAYALLGWSASLEAEHLRIGPTSVRMHDVCNGVPMALSLFLVSYGFVFGTPLRMSVRLGVLLLSPLSAIVCSTVALIATFWLFNDLSVETADVLLRVGEWVMLMVAFLLLIATIRMLSWASVPVRHYSLAFDQ